MAISKRDARELMSRGYEMGAKTLNGSLERQTDGVWVVDDVPMDEWLQAMEGRQVVIVAAEVHSGHGETRVCPVCGTEYEGYACPRCRQARLRLRGRA